MAKIALSDTSWCSSSMARKANWALSAGMSTRTTSGFAARTRRATGSEPATGKFAQVCTVRATLVPSTSTCSRARCSLSVATMTTDSSGIETGHIAREPNTPDYLLLSNFDGSRYGFTNFGPSTDSLLGEIRFTVHSTMSSELLFCMLLLRKKLPKIGISPNPGILL